MARKAPPRGLSQHEYATRVELSAGQVRAMKREGRLVHGADGKIDFAASERELERRHQERLAAQRPSAVKKQRERYALLLAKLDFEKRSGKLIDREQAQREAFEVGKRVKEIVMSLPDRLAGLVSAESDQARNHALILRECAEACESMARWCGVASENEVETKGGR